LVVGLAYWVVYTVQNIKPIHADNGPPKAPLADWTLTPGPSDGFMTYTNNRVGFSVLMPSEIMSPYGASCGTSDLQADGTHDRAANSFIPAPGVQNMNVFVTKEGQTFYLAETNTYQPGGQETDSEHHTFYGDCVSLQTNMNALRSFEDKGGPYHFSTIAIWVIPAKNEAVLTPIAQRLFQDSSIKVKSLVKDPAGDWQNVTFDCGGAACKHFGSADVVRYYAARHKFIYIRDDQGKNLRTPDGKSYYDPQVVASFKVLK